MEDIDRLTQAAALALQIEALLAPLPDHHVEDLEEAADCASLVIERSNDRLRKIAGLDAVVRL